MNKTHLTIVITVLLVITISLTYLLIPKQTSKVKTTGGFSKNILEPHKYTYVPEEEIEENETESKAPALDLTKLQGKDRLYTEEEGQYENLSEEEKKLVENVSCDGDNRLTWLCDPEYINFVSLISLYNGIAVVSLPHSMANSILYIYDINNQNITGSFIDSWNTAYGVSYIIRRGGNNSALELYRPGMTSFVTIPDSELEDDLHYLEWKEMIIRDFPVTFNGDIITVTIFKYDCDGSVINGWSGMPETCTNIIKGTRTFDLSNLP